MARILIAEDDPNLSLFLKEGLGARGFSTVVADDGEEAQALSLTDEFDLLILDLGLPRRDGFDVLRELRARGRTLPVLVLTGRSERDAAACLQAGADDYLRKPFDFEELVERVRARLRAKDELRDLRRIVQSDRPPMAHDQGAAGGPDPDS